MKTSVVPAQITTVEDKIAGNMTFAQILFLVIPLILGTIVYIFVPPGSHLNIMKAVIIGFQFFAFGLLAVRIKGQTIADKILIFLRYSLRPHLYVFTKNDLATRDVVLIEKTKKKTRTKKNITKDKNDTRVRSKIDKSLMSQVLTDPSLMVRLELGKKGGIDVSFSADKE
jgi:hypothetical protein